jgi:hypothetical protein
MEAAADAWLLEEGGDVSFKCVRSMVVSGGANFGLTTFEWDHGMSSQILGGLRPFLATSGGECGLGGTFWVVPFMVGHLDLGMTIYICEGSEDVHGSAGGSGGSV